MKRYINPDMLIWAREKCKYTKEALASKMKKDVELISRWEGGIETPSYTTLEKLAYTYYKVPLALFFFPEPPSMETPKKKLRRLPDYELDRFTPDTYHKISLGQAYQISLDEIFSGNKPNKQIFKDIRYEGNNIINMAQEVRKYLGVSIKQQFAFKSSDEAFKAWRHAVETAGIFTFKDSFDDKFISGFCLLNDEFPIIFINNSNSFNRQIFSLIHELGHILHGVNGVSDIDETYFDYLTEQNKRIEINTNKFAAELLVPNNIFINDIVNFKNKGVQYIETLANKYSVSREVILRRLLDNDEIDVRLYKELADKWNKEYLRQHIGNKGGNYYLTKLSYLGEGYTKLVFDSYRGGRFNGIKLAEHLNINSLNISKFEKYLRW